jgi:hypothetical protein
MANAFSVTDLAAQAMANALTTYIDTGTQAVINIYDGTAPADANASLSSNNLLAQLTMSTTSFGGAANNGTNARITANAITADASADSTGTASFFRILQQSAGTVCAQGSVGTASADLILNTTAITSGSQVSITAATIDLPRE